MERSIMTKYGAWRSLPSQLVENNGGRLGDSIPPAEILIRPNCHSCHACSTLLRGRAALAFCTGNCKKRPTPQTCVILMPTPLSASAHQTSDGLQFQIQGHAAR